MALSEMKLVKRRFNAGLKLLEKHFPNARNNEVNYDEKNGVVSLFSNDVLVGYIHENGKSEIITKSNPGIDVTANEIRFRIKNPTLFNKFRVRWFVKNGKRMGIYIIYGRPKVGGTWKIQSLRFKKDKYTRQQALDWVKRHKDSIKMWKQH